MKFPLKMINGLVLIERWGSPFKIFRVVRVERTINMHAKL
jgi:hypothetical protein